MKRKLVRITVWVNLITVCYFVLAYLLAVVSVSDCGIPESILKGVHTDYRFAILQSVPRSFTSYCLAGPPILLMGNQDNWAKHKNGEFGPKAIPKGGEWQLSFVRWRTGWPVFLPYFAFNHFGWHFRVGTRWDDVDQYYTVPTLAFKRSQ